MSIDRRTSLRLLLSTGIALSGGAGAAFAGGALETGSAWRFSFQAIDGGSLPLAALSGKVLLIVNTASKCGYTGQYKGLQTLWQDYRDRGLVVIGVPSNDFGGQEPGTDQDIKGFCGATFGVTFPLAGKTVVRGTGAHPFYRWASEVLGAANAPRWNFHKYLVDADGRLIAAFPSSVTPEDARIKTAIERALPRPS